MKYFLIFLMVIIVLIFVVIYFIRQKLREWSNLFFGTDSFAQGLRQQEERLAHTPKSVSSMTKIYMPLITKDFPQFNLYEFHQKAETMLKSVFSAIEHQKMSFVVNGSKDLINQVQTYIQDLQSQNLIERYDNVKIHQTEIAKYTKEAGTCVIVFQMAIEYYRYRLEEEKIVQGRKDLKIQTKYNVDLVYIQDASKVKGESYQNAMGLTCPHCGGPVTTLGQKKCDYCGAGIKEINVHTWFLNKYQEVK
jgi:hypothetical protein